MPEDINKNMNEMIKNQWKKESDLIRHHLGNETASSAPRLSSWVKVKATPLDYFDKDSVFSEIWVNRDTIIYCFKYDDSPEITAFEFLNGKAWVCEGPITQFTES